MSQASGLYIHLPFCAQKCPYCGFYSVCGTSPEAQELYLSAILEELRSFEYPKTDSIYIGGGTPSVLGMRLPAFIESVLSLINYNGGEFTVEVNPESLSPELCSALNELPVTRISMGVQSLSDAVLKHLGRPHDARQALKAYDMLRLFAPSVSLNIDMIYDIPEVPLIEIRKTLLEFIRMQPEHISAYSYSPDTGYLTDTACQEPEQMDMVYDILAAAGYGRYEISNFALPGRESQHNIKYWSMLPYIGLGAAAHSMIYNRQNGHTRWCHDADIDEYIKNPLERKNIESYTGDQSLKEALVFGLRMRGGVDLKEIEARYSVKAGSEIINKINELTGKGLLERQGSLIKASDSGTKLLNSVMDYLW